MPRPKKQPVKPVKRFSKSTKSRTKKSSLHTRLNTPLFNLRKDLKIAITVVILVAVGGFAYLSATSAAAPVGEAIYESLPSTASPDTKTSGLKKVKENAVHPCAGSYEVADKKDTNGNKLCTTTSESITDGKATVSQTVNLQKKVRAMRPKKASETLDTIKRTGKIAINPEIAQDFQAVSSASGSISLQGASPTEATAPTCYGNGKDGKRIVLVAAGTPTNPISQSDIDLIQNVAGQMESNLMWNSYRQNPDKIMHWRFFQSSSDCKPIVMTATQAANYYNELSVGTYAQLHGDAGIRAAANAAKAQGPTMTPHFLVFTRSGANACGQSDFNVGGGLNNKEAFSFVYGAVPSDRSGTVCWSGSVAQHEFLHSIGAVDFSAPHTTFFAHCNDEHDIMCYNDTGMVSLQTLCQYPELDSWSAEQVMDCNADDYFSVKANADAVFNPVWWQGGQGLARYNIAKSGFMTDIGPTPSLQPPTPPTVKITLPASSLAIPAGSSQPVVVAASDTDGIAKVELFNGTTKLGEVTAAPYNFMLSPLPGTSASIKAVAYDKKGASATSEPVVITITPRAGSDKTAPVGPANYAISLNFDLTQGGYGLALTWPAATDNIGVTKYRILRNNKEVGTSTKTSYRDKAIAAGTNYSYKIVAEDAAGLQSVGSATKTNKINCFLIFCGLQ